MTYNGIIIFIQNMKNLPINPVVIFDIDDTLINSMTGKPNTHIIEIYNYVKSVGIKPILITARSNSPETIKYTYEQLSAYNISIHNFIYFRPENEFNIAKYKREARKDVKNRGMNAIMSIGDMDWDLGDYGGIGIKIEK